MLLGRSVKGFSSVPDVAPVVPPTTLRSSLATSEGKVGGRVLKAAVKLGRESEDLSLNREDEILVVVPSEVVVEVVSEVDSCRKVWGGEHRAIDKELEMMGSREDGDDGLENTFTIWPVHVGMLLASVTLSHRY